MRQMGQVAGIAIASMVWVTREQGYLAAGFDGPAALGTGFRDAYLVLSVAGVLAIIASALRGRQRPVPASEKAPHEETLPSKIRASTYSRETGE